MRRCAEHPLQPEFSLCGDAFDIYETEGDDAEPFAFVKRGQTVTCDNCRDAITKLRRNFTSRGFTYYE